VKFPSPKKQKFSCYDDNFNCFLVPAIINLLKSTIVGSLATNCSRSGEINFILAPEHLGLLSYASPLDWRPELRPDPTLGRSRQRNRLKNTASNCAKSGLINSPDDLMLFERADERVKLMHGQIPRLELSPMCRVPGNNYAETSTQHSAASDQWALSGVRLSTRLDTCARQKVGPAGQHCSSFIPLDFSVLRPGRKGSSQCSQTSFFLSLPRWRLRSYCGAADLRFVGGVDHA